MDYASQLDFKRKLVADCLKKIGGLDVDVQPVVGSDKVWGYRNKMQLPVGADSDGNTAIGFFAERSHRIVPVAECRIHPSWSKDIISALRSYMEANSVKGYDEKNKSGDIRHIVVRELSGKFIITLVTTKRKLRNIDDFIKRLSEKIEEFTLLINVNDGDSNVIFGPEFIAVMGDGFYEAEECGIKYEAGASTFIQVNDGVRNKLYAEALKKVAGEGDEVVIDCYSGGGLLTAMAAKKCKRAYGIEIVAEATECANSLKIKNSLEDKMINVCGDVATKLPEIMAKEKNEKVRLILDPPRAGISRGVLHAIAQSGIEKLVLISCNPSTLARDLGILTGTLKEENGALIKGDRDGNYVIDSVQPFDMFPQTKHVETLVVLSKKIHDSHINVDVEFGEGEGQFSLKKIKERAEVRKPKEKVTYKKIQDYIEKTYGFKVHTAYIAEVKRDLGLPMYDAPNAVEELKRPRAHPTPKMVEAIKQTLKHFEVLR